MRDLGKRLAFPLALAVLPALTGAARAGDSDFDTQMEPVLEFYLPIPKTLAADETAGVQRAAERIRAAAAGLDPSGVSGEQRDHLRQIPQKLETAAEKLAAAEDIDAMREALKALSKPMALWATLRKPDGVSVMYCSMAPGSWLQKDDTRIANPYYGAKMLRCGEIVAGPGAGDKSSHMKSGHMKSGHMKSGDGQHSERHGGR